jgi:MFS family permease
MYMDGVQGTLKDRWLIALCGSRTLMYAMFMVYAASLPVLMREWDMSAAQAGTVSGAFMLAYAASLVASAWLAERFGARNVFMWSAWSSGITSIAFGLLARDYVCAVLLYALAAVTQGGTYAPALMLFADRYPTSVRGRAVGMLIASTSIGYALSLLVAGVLLGIGGYQLAFVVCGALPMLGAVLSAMALRDTPNVIHARSRGESSLRAMLGNRDGVRLIIGYTGHSWELLGMWQWLPAFLAASLALAGDSAGEAAALGAGFTAAMHICGSFASSTMGGLSDRLGRRTVLLALAALGAAFSLGLGWLVAMPFWLLVLLSLGYGFVSVGDSPVLSTALTEAMPSAHLGTALATRSILGFGGGAMSPVVFGMVLDATATGPAQVSWGLAFASLGVGGLVATWFAARLGMHSHSGEHRS